jgi:hypothetical protein
MGGNNSNNRNSIPHIYVVLVFEDLSAIFILDKLTTVHGSANVKKKVFKLKKNNLLKIDN